jgi:hypothetical protein
MVIHVRGRQGWAALPVLWLSATMLLFQNLNALYFFYPARPNVVNMHNVFWVMFGLMVLYVAVRPRPAAGLEGTSDGEARRFAWAQWIGGAMAALALVIVLAGFINGESTMISANTRWPVWSWRDGPFPGRADAP